MACVANRPHFDVSLAGRRQQGKQGVAGEATGRRQQSRGEHQEYIDLISLSRQNKQYFHNQFYAYLSAARNSLIGTKVSLPRLRSSGDLEALSKHVLHTGVANQVLSFRKDFIFLRVYNDNDS